MTEKHYDFFISYNHKDEGFASWISYLLEDAGYKVFYQAWDFKTGNNFIIQMQHGAKFANHTLALISQNYLGSTYTQPEWAAAFASDPTGMKQKFMPVRIEDIELEGLLPQIIYIDLVGKDEDEAKSAILEGVLTERKKPNSPPPFPGMIPMQKNEIIQEKWYENWLETRIKELEQNNFAEDIIEGAKFTVHLVPFESIAKDFKLPLEKLKQPNLLKPFYTTGWDYKINKDGYCTFAKWPISEKPHAYVQFFKNGIIESVDTGILRQQGEKTKYIPFVKFEKDIIQHTYKYLQAIKTVDIKLPIALNITLFNISDYFVGDIKSPRGKISESPLKLPTVIINSWDVKLETLLKSSYDLIWNHCGYEGSLNYDADGNWREFNGNFF